MDIGMVVALIKKLAPAASPEAIQDAVDAWLTAHPEATTTVQDGSITEAKLAQELAATINGMDSDVSSLKSAMTLADGTIGSGTVNGAGFRYIRAAISTVSGVKHWKYMENDGSGTSIAFNPQKHATYTVSATNNNRLRVYGIKNTEMIASTIPYGDYIVEIIDESETSLSSVTFNSGDYDLIIVYLKNANDYNLTWSVSYVELYPVDSLTKTKLVATAANEDGTITLVKSVNYQGESTGVMFTPETNTDYVVQAKKNDRLRIYGTNVYYDPKTFDYSSVGVELIENADATPRTVAFNSGNYKTIFIYLYTGSDSTVVIDASVSCTKHTMSKDLRDAQSDIDGQSYTNILLSKKLIPFIPTTIPATALLYHAAWDELVDGGFVTRSEPTYMSTDTEEICPLYTYTINAYNQYMQDYEISENDLSEIYSRPKILVVSGHHGDEPCTPWALLNFVKRMVQDKAYMQFVGQFEWTIIPLVNPTGFNARSRYNAQDKDINRDYNDTSKFATEEAQYVRDVFLSKNFAIAFDMHQAPFNESDYTIKTLGFAAMNIKRTGDSEEDYQKVFKKYAHNIQGACANTDKAMMLQYGWKNIGQTAFLWEYRNPTADTFTNYVAGRQGNTTHTDHHTLFNVVLETSTRCSYLSHLTTNYNRLTVQYTNVFMDEVIKAAIKTLESVT